MSVCIALTEAVLERDNMPLYIAVVTVIRWH